MEGFSRYMDRVANQDLFRGFSVSPSSISINHLHYEDDIIFFIDHKKEELHNLFSSLQCFEYIAGLKVNTSKTRLIAVENVPELPIWAEEFGCPTDCLPFMYLGMPLGAKSVSKSIWVAIIEKFDSRLSPWRKISLSKGGKFVLLKCILSSLPSYYFSLFKAPVSIIKILEKKMQADDYAALLTLIGDTPPIADGLADTRRWSLHASGSNTWSLIHGKLNTKDVLQHKGIPLHYSCVLCGDAPESQNHLFLHCKVAFRVWSMLLPSSHYAWVIPRTIQMLASSWLHTNFSSNGNFI
ncbi:uncharacterized protein LOC113342540 [Papaver somniferum]|uniref:uncharacterized protein LOC113342540 n=1 Tax=Papaver somniferum TaxID=3469 RepID=UPI000E700467|nr:uncharacterized protein LOC113342540 [Papaver somniferum]